MISIHAPLTGSDRVLSDFVCDAGDFNPRSPYGERRKCQISFPSGKRFQSTLPLRGATIAGDKYASARPDFNPRSPYGERPRPWKNWVFFRTFQSTLPLRGATIIMSPRPPPKRISIHAPLTGSDWFHLLQSAKGGNFNPRSPYGERLAKISFAVKPYFISIHAPLTGSDKCRSINIDARNNFNPRSPYGERLNVS